MFLLLGLFDVKEIKNTAIRSVKIKNVKENNFIFIGFINIQ